MINNLTLEKCDSDQRKAQDIDIVDVSTGVATLDMDATVAVKKGHLEELDSSVLLELCLQKGINTSSFRLDKNSLYPHRDTMIEALLNSAMVSVDLMHAGLLQLHF